MISPIDVATRGYLNSPLSVAVDGYLTIGTKEKRGGHAIRYYSAKAKQNDDDFILLAIEAVKFLLKG